MAQTLCCGHGGKCFVAAPQLATLLLTVQAAALSACTALVCSPGACCAPAVALSGPARLQVGHAVCGTLTPGHDVVQKVTLIPRGQARLCGCLLCLCLSPLQLCIPALCGLAEPVCWWQVQLQGLDAHVSFELALLRSEMQHTISTTATRLWVWCVCCVVCAGAWMCGIGCILCCLC